MIASIEELEAVGIECRALVRRRARAAGALAAIPVMGIDLAGDVALLLEVIPAINRRFGLEQEQLDRLDSATKIAIYRVARKFGGQFIGQAVTADLIVKVIARVGVSIAAESVLKFIPLAGTVAATMIAYYVFRKIAYSHIEDCEKIVRELIESPPTTTFEQPATEDAP